MRNARRAILLLSAAALLAASSAFAQAEKPAGGPDQAAMEQMMAMMQPGPEHQDLAKMVGKWKAHNKMWMDPSGPPMESEGASEYMAVMGGRYIHGSYKSVMMGMPFEGMSVDGYDRYKKQYFSLWFDNMGTGFLAMWGNPSADGKTMTLTGTMFDPEQGKDVAVRSVTKHIDDNTVLFEMYSMKGGKEVKAMEITYKRM